CCLSHVGGEDVALVDFNEQFVAVPPSEDLSCLVECVHAQLSAVDHQLAREVCVGCFELPLAGVGLIGGCGAHCCFNSCSRCSYAATRARSTRPRSVSVCASLCAIAHAHI